MRVCRQIRHEYAKIHAKSARLRLHWDDLSTWVATFCLESIPAKEVIIMISPLDRKWRVPVTIMSLLQLNARCHNDLGHSIVRFEEPTATHPEYAALEYWARSSGRPERSRVLAGRLNTLFAHRNEDWLRILRREDKRMLVSAEMCLGWYTLMLRFWDSEESGYIRPTLKDLGMDDWDASHHSTEYRITPLFCRNRRFKIDVMGTLLRRGWDN